MTHPESEVEGHPLARPPDPERRARILARATDHVLAHGLAGLSLRPLAAALGTSTRMLLYDFGSKEQLVTELLAEARRRQALLYAERFHAPGASRRETVELAWEWLTAEERAPYMRLLFEVYVDAMARPEAYADGGSALVADWLGFFAPLLRGSDVDSVDVTVILAVLRGLLLDRLTAPDPERTDRAFARFAALLRD
ncbi:TetR/AcrR family transcriptional regulator [Streptoalloteichus hindustanus]|uniref:Transcriptional regulator, TetR family n=1 Tax=Streptoalloteichus hindustanus TaxID=2017 RepID=A0A1M4UJF3_STRHI|nr:TetR/AcrR family transcriptional regulator [Streptoalloteichus hindustanus]SHE56912.1 transcriptional regulator, TetR family [Streptoalloteichus hindustanus]